MRKLGISAMVTVMCAGSVGAGVVYEIETSYEGREPSVNELSVQGELLKMGIERGPSGQSGDLIWRGDRREMVVVDHEDKTYMVLDEATIERLTGQVNQALSSVQEAMKNLPESQRAMMEKMMKDQMPQVSETSAAVEVRPTQETQTHHGYPCVKYIVNVDGVATRELWVTDWSRIPGGAETAGAFEGLLGFFSEMLESVGQVAGGFPGLGEQLNGGLMIEMREIDGFPVVTRGLDAEGEVEDESSLRSATERDLDPDAFEPPAGYKLRSMLPQ